MKQSTVSEPDVLIYSGTIRRRLPARVVAARLAMLAVGTALLSAPWIVAVLYPSPRATLMAIGSFVLVFVGVVVAGNLDRRRR